MRTETFSPFNLTREELAERGRRGAQRRWERVRGVEAAERLTLSREESAALREAYALLRRIVARAEPVAPPSDEAAP